MAIQFALAISLLSLLTGCNYFDPVTAAKFAYKDIRYPITKSAAYHPTPTPTPTK